jgi:signal transduction histidine kinase
VRFIATDRLTTLFAISAGVSVAVVCWIGYRAVTESRAKSLLLAEQQSSRIADLVLSALARDMSGVQVSVLTSAQWNQFQPDHPHEVNELVASAFARYPYPDAFFAWKAATPFTHVAFFARAERRPPWTSNGTSDFAFPVDIQSQPVVAARLMNRIAADAKNSRILSVFELPLGGEPYQVVAQLTYSDIYRQQLASVVGFTVNLQWVRAHYFAELAGEVWTLGKGAETGLIMHIRDDQDRVVAGSAFDEGEMATHRRTFDLLFLDSVAVFPVRGYAPQTWSIAVTSASAPTLFRETVNTTRLVAFGGISGLVFATGLVLTVRAARARARLTELRTDFVSTVTHELKTPIATIKAAAETLARDRLTGMSVQTCGRIVVMESDRLARLVENLLAYSRITDVADTYRFVPVDVAAVLNDIQENFEARLDQHGFELDIRIASGTKPVRGERFALRLLFGNLVDNAIKYSGAQRRLTLTASGSDAHVIVEVKDTGIGIDAAELPHVLKKFGRGKTAPHGGSGLGLAIASRIAEDHGGSLRIESAPGCGTTVTVTLPAA